MTDDRETTEELKDKYLRTLTWYFGDRPTGFYAQLGLVKDQLATLNERLAESGNVSAALTRSLNRLTLCAVIVASLGVLVAGGHLALEVVKYFNHVAA